MKVGKQHIHDLPENDITWLGGYAQQLQAEAEAQGVILPPPVRLQIGEPSFRTPEHIRLAAIQSIDGELLTYAPAAGWTWLRELIAEKIKCVNGYSVSASNVAVTMGGTGALQAAFDATVSCGDEVLIPNPGWPLYSMQIAASGATPVPYPLDPQNAWYPDLAALEKLVTPHTRILLINSPSNPSGSVFSAQVIAELLAFARRHDLYLLSDECYDQIVFEGAHVSPATMLSPAELAEGRFIGVYAFSKTFAMTGWRIGYLVTSIKLIKTLSDVLNAGYTSMSTITQRAAAAALIGPQDCVIAMRDAYRQRSNLAMRLLQQYGRYAYTPHGAFYVLIDVRKRNGELRDSRQFALDLLRERNVAVAPGRGFGSVSQYHVRISLAASPEEIKRGIREICLFADRL